jgi:transposase
VRKALAAKLVYQGYKYEEIQTILDVSRFAPNCPSQNPIEDI